MLYYRSCIGLWCCRAPPLSGALCKEISVIYDGKSVARSGVLCKGISVTCNGKTQRLFWAFRNSCVTDFHFRSDKKIRVWRWVAVMLSRDSTPPTHRGGAEQPFSRALMGLWVGEDSSSGGQAKRLSRAAPPAPNRKRTAYDTAMTQRMTQRRGKSGTVPIHCATISS